MRETFLPFSPPLIQQEEIDEVVDTLKSNWITTGPKTRHFEQEFAQYTQSSAALALNSCTAGLHTALVTLGVGQGDEVITTPMTFAASVNVIEHTGARPVLVDVEPDTLNIDPRLIRAAITPKTKAILPVHFAGHPVELAEINAIADEYGLAIVEDAAHAIGAKYQGTPIGGTGNPTAFSFYATKNLTTGEGGMLTGDSKFLERARVISLHGMSREAWKRYQQGGTWRYDLVAPGFKYNMTDIQASLGTWQLKRFESYQRRRREIAALYNNAFRELPSLELPAVREGVEHAWHLYPIRLHLEQVTINRDQFIDELTAQNIGTSVHFIPIHLHSYYKQKYGLQAEDFPEATHAFQRILSLPLNQSMSDSDAWDVINAVSVVVERHGSTRAAA